MLEECKGHVHVFGKSSNGFYAMDPMIKEAEGSKVIILGIPLAFAEIVQQTVTLDDRRTLYLFGTAWNQVSVSGILLLGENSTRGDQLSKLRDWYETNRVSVKRGPVKLSIGTSGIEAYVVGLRLDQANPNTNTQMFTIEMMTADITKTGKK